MDLQKKYEKIIEDYLQENKFEDYLGPVENYALQEGKRLRPYMTLAWCEFYGGNAQDAISYAMAIEYIHNMSLIYDDLPCMDNDNYRRDRETTHKKFGEAAAILAGGGLIAAAFKNLTECYLPSDNKIEAVQALSNTIQLMASGQYLETFKTFDITEVNSRKTAVLFGLACEFGALASMNSNNNRIRSYNWGYNFGLAYQKFDDLIDNKKKSLEVAFDESFDSFINGSNYLEENSPPAKFLNEIVNKIKR